jgi:hypothetical protein
MARALILIFAGSALTAPKNRESGAAEPKTSPSLKADLQNGASGSH